MVKKWNLTNLPFRRETSADQNVRFLPYLEDILLVLYGFSTLLLLARLLKAVLWRWEIVAFILLLCNLAGTVVLVIAVRAAKTGV